MSGFSNQQSEGGILIWSETDALTNLGIAEHIHVYSTE